ncbi:MAG TPA: DNA polymerase III subunit gamma/tau, partial [Bacillota bacterium]|nr:DNA polymerase III subunit gamma/tau [Bacillota bacterium]
DAASNNGVDDVREIKEAVMYVPAVTKYKVYIIDEVHMLTTEAFNALLKTLEEPPAHVIFIFATTEVQKVPATILSRCQRFDFKRLSVPEIVERLENILREEGREGEPEALHMIALRADGGMRDAIGLLEQTLAHAEARITAKDVREVLGLVEEEQIFLLVKAILSRDVAGALRSIEALRTEGKDLYLMARESAYFLRDLLLLALPDEAGSLVQMEGEFRSKCQQLAKSVSLVRLRRAAEIMFDTAQVVRRGAEGALPLEVAIVRLVSEDEMDPYDKVAILEERLNRLEKNGVSIAGSCEATPTLSNVKPTEAKQTQVTPKSAVKTEKENTPTKAEKPKEIADGMPSVSSLSDRWEELLKALKEKKRTVEALLREGQPGSCQNDRWIIYFAPHLQFHLDNLNQPTTKSLINETASQVVGRTISVDCKSIDEKPAKGDPPTQTEPQTPKQSDDFLEKSLAILGGEAVQIKEEKNS